MHVVTNNSKELVVRANTKFKPGKNEFPETKFTLGDVVQIDKHPALTISLEKVKEKRTGDDNAK